LDDAEAASSVIEHSLTDLKARQRRLPGTSKPIRNPSLLPLHLLQPEVFEATVAEIIASERSRSVHFYGRRGQAQHGLDIVRENRDGTRILYQVKRFSEMTPAALRDAVTTYAGTPRDETFTGAARVFHPQEFVVVTSAAIDDDTALVNAVADLQDQYRGDLGIDVWGAETVSRKLRKHRGLVEAVCSEAWANEWCGSSAREQAQLREKRRQHVDNVLRAVMQVQFAKDNEIRFRQVDLTGVSVDSLFVDVPARTHSGSSAEKLLLEMNAANSSQSEGITTSPKAGAAQALLHPSWVDSTVIVGGPGQGKTTLLQFLCQY
jgi:hypothetical protein